MLNEDKRYYGLYEGICWNNEDPSNKSRITLLVPQVLGDKESNWAPACLPVTSNSNHPDHMPHTDAQVAALLSTGPGGIDGHTHAVIPAGGSLTHPHTTVANIQNLWNDVEEIKTSTPEHTPHRHVPHKKQKVWVMFIGGDPNFPVWIGVEL